MDHLQPHRCVQVAFAGLFVLAASVFFGGCAVAPQVAIIGQQIVDETDEARRVEFVAEMTNPSDVAIELRELEYRLRLDGRTVYSGRRAAQATLPAGGSVQVVMPAVIALDAHAPTAPSRYQISGSVSYITPGVIARMLRDVGMPRPWVGFAHDGQLLWQ